LNLNEFEIILDNEIELENFEENNVEYWLPMFLSIGYWPTVLLPKKEFNGRFNNTYTSKQDNQKTFGMRNGNSSYIDNTDKDIELAEKMIQMLNPERFFKETFWKDVGKALYIADDGGDNGILSWIRHSKKSIEGLRTTPDFMLVDGSIDDTCKNLYYTFFLLIPLLLFWPFLSYIESFLSQVLFLRIFYSP